MNHTTMKATAVISEAWRSITSGAARLARPSSPWP